MRSLFGERIVENVVDGKLGEAMVKLALRDCDWHGCAAWEGWDFKRAHGTKLEANHASIQIWDDDPPESPTSSPSPTGAHIIAIGEAGNIPIGVRAYDVV